MPPLQDLKSLAEQLSAAQAAAAPKPKFAFKRQTKPTAAQSTTAPAPSPQPSNDEAGVTRRTVPAVPPTALKLEGLPQGYISFAELGPDVPAGSSSLLIASLSGSLVDLLPRPIDGSASSSNGPVSYSALYLYNLTDCVVLLPLNNGSVMLHNCHRCIIVVGVHQVSYSHDLSVKWPHACLAKVRFAQLTPLSRVPQFRMHDSTDCTVLLQTFSRPIIERCDELRFGSYPSSLSVRALALRRCSQLGTRADAPAYSAASRTHSLASSDHRPSTRYRTLITHSPPPRPRLRVGGPRLRQRQRTGSRTRGGGRQRVGGKGGQD